MHLGLRTRMPLILRTWRLLVGRRGMRLRGRMRRRGSGMLGIVLSADGHRYQ